MKISIALLFKGGISPGEAKQVQATCRSLRALAADRHEWFQVMVRTSEELVKQGKTRKLSLEEMEELDGVKEELKALNDGEEIPLEEQLRGAARDLELAEELVRASLSMDVLPAP